MALVGFHYEPVTLDVNEACFDEEQDIPNTREKSRKSQSITEWCRCRSIYTSKFTGEHPCQSVISIKLQSNFIEITLWHGCSPVNFLYIFRKPFPKNTSGWLLL